MANVEIYTWRTCPFCIRAKELLDKKGVKYTEYSIDGDETARNKMADRSDGRRSVPQIFVNDVHIGGEAFIVCDQDKRGALRLRKIEHQAKNSAGAAAIQRGRR